MAVLFLCDVDGTLVKSGQSPTGRTIEAVREFTRRGGVFGLSTGRSAQSVTELIAMLGVNGPCVLCSGALVYDFQQQRRLCVQYLDDSIYGLLRTLMDEYPAISLTVYTAHAQYTLRKNECLMRSGVYEDRMAPAAELNEVSGMIKVLFSCDDAQLLRQIQRDRIDPSRFSCYAASTHFYEITAAGVCKGSALGVIRENLEKPGERLHLFSAGDGLSDLTMKPECELFFAPKTALPEVCRAADRLISPPLEGGVAEAIAWVLDQGLLNG